MNCSNIKSEARENLKGKWGIAVLCYLIYSVLIGVVECLSAYTIGLLGLLIIGPLNYGFYYFSQKINRRGNPETSNLFEGFNRFGETFYAGFLIYVYEFLWTLLLIIPGIVASYSYALTYYLMIDDKNLKAKDAITKSKELMRGHKWELFVLDLSFIGWILLSILTFGIGFLWLIPYMQVAHASFYDELVGGSASITNADEFEEEGSADVVYTLKCQNCGAKETHTQKTMECPYCGAKMKAE